MKNYIKKEFSKINCAISDRQAEQFLRYFELLTEWNAVLNLTAITEFEEVVEKHFVDSALLYEYIRENKVNMLGMPLPNEEKISASSVRRLILQ